MKFLVLLLTVVSMAALTGCGKDKANALSAYKGVSLVKPHGMTTPDQTMGNLAFRITPIKADGVTTQFFAGEPGIAQFQLDILDANIKSARLVLAEGAPGMTLVQASSNVWQLKWTPAADAKSLRIVIRAETLSAINEKMNNAYKDLEQIVEVAPSKQMPSITSNTVPPQVEEGVNVSFNISIKDPASKGNAPTLEIASYNGGLNAENMKFSALPYFQAALPRVSSADGIYTYTYTLELANRALPQAKTAEMNDDKNAEGVNLCFVTRVVSQTTKNRSEDSTFCIKALYAAQPPVVDWKNDSMKLRTSEDLTAGTQQTVEFTAHTLNGKGNVKVANEKLQAFLKALPSEKDTTTSLDCGDQTVEANSRVCTLTWTPSCKLSLNKSYDLNIDMTASLSKDKPSKSRRETRKLIIYKKAESCEGTGV